MPVWKRVPRGPNPSVLREKIGRGEPDRRVGDRLAQRGERLRPGDPDRVDPRPALEPYERGGRVLAERAVERSPRESRARRAGTGARRRPSPSSPRRSAGCRAGGSRTRRVRRVSAASGVEAAGSFFSAVAGSAGRTKPSIVAGVEPECRPGRPGARDVGRARRAGGRRRGRASAEYRRSMRRGGVARTLSLSAARHGQLS